MYGSSPQAWGTWPTFSVEHVSIRFIPTGVGNIPEYEPPGLLGTVHPHRRGEHETGYLRTPAASGSSPQAWGTCHHKLVTTKVMRFIPTGVGNMPLLSYSFLWTWVHPHRRGEHVGDNHPEERTDGSSPQAWGTYYL